jgi:O-antigen/teichoic acid export membrane protein
VSKIIKSFFHNIVGSFLLKVIGILIGVVVARKLSIYEYGLYTATISAVVLFGSTLANTVVLVTTSFATSDTDDLKHELSYYIYSFFFVFLYCIILFFGQLFFASDAGFKVLIIIISILAYAPALGFFNAQDKAQIFGKFASISFLVSFILLCLQYQSLTFTFFDALLIYALPYIVLAILINTQVLIIALNSKIKFNDLRFKFVYFKKMSRQIISLLIASFLVPLVFWIIYNKINLNKQEIISVAIFASCMQWGWLLSQLSIVAGNSLVSRLQRDRSQDDSLSFINSFSVLLPISIFASSLLIFPQIHELVFGENFSLETIRVPLTLVMLVAVFNSFKSSIQRRQVAMQMNYISLLSNFLWGIIFISLILVFRVNAARDLSLFYLVSTVIAFICILPIYLHKELFSWKELVNFPMLLIVVLICHSALSNVYMVNLWIKLPIFILIMLITISFFSFKIILLRRVNE